MRRKKDGRPHPLINIAQERTDIPLGCGIEADRRFIQNENGRLMQHRRRQIASHPLAERQLADRRVHEIRQAQQVLKLFDPVFFPFGGQAVHSGQNIVGIAQRQIPPQLGALAEQHAERARGFLALAVGIDSPQPDFSLGGMQNSGQHFDGRGFAGSVRTDESGEFAFRNRKADVRNGLFRNGAAAEQAAPLGRCIRVRHPEFLCKSDRLDHFHSPFLHEPVL
ncbi:hypothetical protein BN871_BM_00480 [Paenibacillus sp. P22]|nr:hypothetical protein BN871_BM_00480 [Paenibacillus sp. P22]